MSPTQVVGFWVIAVLLIALPGPDWAFTIAAGVRDRTVYPAVGGLMAGYVLLTGVVAAGVGALVAGTPAILTVLTVIGAAYLLYLGSSLLKDPGSPGLGTEDAAEAVPWWARSLRGAGVSCLNPKALVLFLALLPQFTDPSGAWPIPVQIALLGALYIVTCGAFYSAVGAGARAVALTRPRVMRALPRVSGIAMVALGLVMLGENVVPLL
ncbi:LysE family translocator [Hoyosella subflava]|uniref:Like to dihydrodipicolinate reductase n=1 Tax=Hoyosella subflava (strain DSM 45089 / JCM 17490 / NBRC 109087 / DQS3-9A1) TaxID=443218 RepID=F6EQC5_HOYSD|nr:LysE family translocator [Hoyosella subflava]AEF40610.1 like to dihydrodipicolinate reductase [Hoyosella subflava DQS3-9A1]